MKDIRLPALECATPKYGININNDGLLYGGFVTLIRNRRSILIARRVEEAPGFYFIRYSGALVAYNKFSYRVISCRARKGYDEAKLREDIRLLSSLMSAARAFQPRLFAGHAASSFRSSEYMRDRLTTVCGSSVSASLPEYMRYRR